MSALKPLRGPFDGGMPFDGGPGAGTSATFSPSSLGLDVWLDSAVGITLTSSAVSQWVSRDANARAFTQGTAGFRPVMRTVGSITGVDFDGSDDLVASANPFSVLFGSQDPNIGFAAVVLADSYGTSATQNKAMAATAASRRYNVGMGNTGFAAHVFTTVPSDVTSQTLMSLSSMSFVFSNTNATEITSGAWATSGASATGGGLSSGADRTLNIGYFSAGEAFDGIIFELFMRRTVFTSAELINLRSYCLARWGV